MTTPDGTRASHGLALSVAVFAVFVSLSACGTPGMEDTPTYPASGATSPAPVLPIQAQASYPHDPAAFTQGLVYHGGRLYESTGRYGESSLREVELTTGSVLRRVELADEYFGEGLALLDDRLYQLTWREQIGFVYGVSDLRQTGTFAYQGEGWGLTTDGTSLILSDGSSALRFIHPETFAVRHTIVVSDGGAAVTQLNELEWVDGEIWANVWRTDRIARIDPLTGRVTAWLDLSALVPTELRGDADAVLNGIARDADGDRIFVTGKLWPVLHEIAGEADGARNGGGD